MGRGKRRRGTELRTTDGLTDHLAVIFLTLCQLRRREGGKKWAGDFDAGWLVPSFLWRNKRPFYPSGMGKGGRGAR